MKGPDIVRQIQEHLTARHVFGEPYERDGATVIPVAAFWAGGGGGSGGGNGQTDGEGAGFGIIGRPVGVYVIRDGEVSWQPAFDLNRVALLGQVVALAALLVVRRVMIARAQKRP